MGPWALFLPPAGSPQIPALLYAWPRSPKALPGEEGGPGISGAREALGKLRVANPKLSPCLTFQTVVTEDFSHLPPEQQRKRLQQQLEERNRELQKEEDQRWACVVEEAGEERETKLQGWGCAPWWSTCLDT